MKEDTKKSTAKPAVKVKDIPPKKDATGGKSHSPERANFHTVNKSSGPGAKR